MIAIIGATGNVGRPLARILADAGEHVAAISRRGPKPADLAVPASIAEAVRGADAAFLLVGGSGEQLDPQAIVSAISSAGVTKLVLLSSIGARTRPHAASHEPLRQLEAAVQASGLAWTILRPGGFDSNAFGWIAGIKQHRTVMAPFADVAIPLVDPDDIAAAAAVALRGDHRGEIYELTGPAPITPRQQAAALSTALDIPLAFVEQTREQAAAMWQQFMPASVVDTTLDAVGTPTADEARVSPDVERVTGRAAQPFAAWAARNAAAFR